MKRVLTISLLLFATPYSDVPLPLILLAGAPSGHGR